MADASAVVVGLLRDGSARELLAREAVAVPHIADAEVAHALRGQVARGEVPAGAALTALRRWAVLGVRRYSLVPLLDRVWALRDNLSAYDAAYVALAEALGCALATADGRLARAPGPSCPVTVISS